MSRTTKSATEFAKQALAAGRAALPDYSSPFSPRKFTQPQLFACLALRQFWKSDYRGTEVRLGEWSDVRDVLGLAKDKVPDFTTLIKAEGPPFKKCRVAALLDHTVARACELKLIEPSDADDKSRCGAGDSTGLESGHTSHYFGKRSGKKKRRFPKLWVVIHAASHVCLSLACGVGPGPDDPKFAAISADAKRRLDPLCAMLADAGFDGEGHHQMLEALKLLGVIPPQRGRPRGEGRQGERGGFFRNFWHGCWEQVKDLYGQRWQVETFFSMLKRLLDSFLRATKRWSRHREMCLKAITLNLMLLAHAHAGL